MRKVRGILLIIFGLALTFYGAATFARYEQEAAVAGQNAQILLNELSREMRQNRVENIAVEAPENQMLQLSLGGYPLIGILKAEKAGIELPVIDSWDYDKLKLAPCRYSGTLDGGDLVLLGHNYDGHLKNLDKLSEGDAVSFIDVSSKEHLFKVDKTEVLAPEDVEKLYADEYPLTIFTCTSTGKSRFAVYCSEKISEK